MQSIGETRRIFAEPLDRVQIDRAVARALDRDRGIAERDRAQRMCGARTRACDHVSLRAHGLTLAVLRSRKARMRRLASLSLCATVAISDSIKRPVCGLASAIIGSAWSTAKFVSGALEATLVASSSALLRPLPASVTYCAKP